MGVEVVLVIVMVVVLVVGPGHKPLSGGRLPC